MISYFNCKLNCTCIRHCSIHGRWFQCYWMLEIIKILRLSIKLYHLKYPL